MTEPPAPHLRDTPKHAASPYALFLRGVMPTNLTMTALAKSLAALGYTHVRTVLASGNAVFVGREEDASVIASRIEAALEHDVGRRFPAVVWPLAALARLVDHDPFAGLAVAPGAKRVLAFLRAPPRAGLTLPVARDGAVLHGADERVAYVSYVASPKGPVFMELIAQCFGDAVTARTYDTVKKVVTAGKAEPNSRPATRARTPRPRQT